MLAKSPPAFEDGSYRCIGCLGHRRHLSHGVDEVCNMPRLLKMGVRRCNAVESWQEMKARTEPMIGGLKDLEIDQERHGSSLNVLLPLAHGVAFHSYKYSAFDPIGTLITEYLYQNGRQQKVRFCWG